VGVPLKDRLIFSHTLEGLFTKALKGKLTDRIRQRVKAEAGIDLDKPFEPAYPFSLWEKCLVICAEEVFPELPVEQRLQEIGLLLTRGYFETLLGSALAALLKVIGPARALKRMDRSLRSGNNYSEVKVTELAPNKFEFWSNETGLAQYNLVGVLRGGAEVSGAKNLRTEVAKRDEDGITILLEWA
jgi:uncharacterized protein (TIGR02265 family)